MVTSFLKHLVFSLKSKPGDNVGMYCEGLLYGIAEIAVKGRKKKSAFFKFELCSLPVYYLVLSPKPDEFSHCSIQQRRRDICTSRQMSFITLGLVSCTEMLYQYKALIKPVTLLVTTASNLHNQSYD